MTNFQISNCRTWKKNVKIKECKILNSWRHWKNTQVFLFILVPNMFSFAVLYQKDLRIMLGKLILKIHTFDKEKVCFKSTGKSSKKGVVFDLTLPKVTFFAKFVYYFSTFLRLENVFKMHVEGRWKPVVVGSKSTLQKQAAQFLDLHAFCIACPCFFSETINSTMSGISFLRR